MIWLMSVGGELYVKCEGAGGGEGQAEEKKERIEKFVCWGGKGGYVYLSW